MGYSETDATESRPTDCNWRPLGKEKGMSETASEVNQAPPVLPNSKRDWLGAITGLAIVCGGLAVLSIVFKEAWLLFKTPPTVALNVQPGKPIDLASAFNAIVGVVVKIILLIIMAWLGSVIANRGIFLYSHSKPGRKS